MEIGGQVWPVASIFDYPYLPFHAITFWKCGVETKDIMKLLVPNTQSRQSTRSLSKRIIGGRVVHYPKDPILDSLEDPSRTRPTSHDGTPILSN